MFCKYSVRIDQKVGNNIGLVEMDFLIHSKRGMRVNHIQVK